MKPPEPLDPAALDAHPLPPVDDGDKHDHGRLLIVAGSKTLPGAALLCATAAMRAGAGKLQIATAASVADALGVAMPESRTVGVEEDEDGGFATSAIADIAELASDVDAVVAGPGMFESSACSALASAVLRTDAACALDAGVLRALGQVEADVRGAKRTPLLLPHAGEMAALLGCDEQEVEGDPLGCGRRCAERFNAMTLVKGVVSHVVAPDGAAWRYEGGAPGLGVSGSGDVLAGIAGGLLARGADPLSALLWAVWLHGEAGARLGQKVGPIGFLAREIPGEVPALLPR